LCCILHCQVLHKIWNRRAFYFTFTIVQNVIQSRRTQDVKPLFTIFYFVQRFHIVLESWQYNILHNGFTFCADRESKLLWTKVAHPVWRDWITFCAIILYRNYSYTMWNCCAEYCTVRSYTKYETVVHFILPSPLYRMLFSHGAHKMWNH
jgi:hypothetical protein